MKRTAKAFGIALAAMAVFNGACAENESAYVTGDGVDCELTSSALTVKSGDATLVAATPSGVLHVWIMAGASLKLAAGASPFATPPVLHVFGTLDVNGASFDALRIDNQPDDALDYVSTHGRIINTSSAAATISLTSNAYQGTRYFGTFEELPGKITVASKNNPFRLRAPADAGSGSPEFALNADAVLVVADRPSHFKFVFQPPADETKPIRIAEIGFTCGGMPVPLKSAVATTEESSAPAARIFDSNSSTYWSAGETGSQTVTLQTYGNVAVDGYRITPYDGVPTTGGASSDGRYDKSYRPSGWDVYAYREGLGYVLVDSKRDFDGWYEWNGSSSTTNMLFSKDTRFGSPFNTSTSITLDNTTSDYAARLGGNVKIETGTFSSKGAVLISDGSTFAPGDISRTTGPFTATPASGAGMSTLELSQRGGAEQRVSVTTPQNLAIVNGGEETVSVLLDDSRAGEHLFGKLADGESGKLGLVKRGSGERVIETEDCTYSGPTAVAKGVLTVARRRTYSARYIKFTVLETKGANADYPWGMNEFQLLDNDGEVVAWPAGTKPDALGAGGFLSSSPGKYLTDGDTTTRCLAAKDKSNEYTLPPVVIDTVSGVSFASYKWWSPHNHSVDASRTPVKWKIEISSDNASWTEISNTEYEWSQEDDDAASAGWTGANSVARGPFVAGLAESTGSAFKTLDSQYLAGDTARDTHGKLKAQYFRFRVFETVAPNASSDSWGWQLTEIGLMKDGERVNWPAVTSGTVLGSEQHTDGMIAKIYNNVIEKGDGSPSNADRLLVRSLPSAVVINAHEPLEFDAYSLTTTAPKQSQGNRLPKTWTLEISMDGSSYVKVDEVNGYTPSSDVLTKTYQEMGPFPVADKWPLLDAGAGDSLGDESPVTIASGATLKLATDYEKFGPLSGAGTLELQWNAAGEINAVDDAVFSGTVSGNGTLAVCGGAVQTFDGADLSGAATLELNSGTIAGSAYFGGKDATIAFNGGATGASLSGIGTLTVSGSVKYAAPAVVAGANHASATLFEAESIPAAAQELLRDGTVEDSGAGFVWKVAVTGTSVTLRGAKPCTILTIR